MSVTGQAVSLRPAVCSHGTHGTLVAKGTRGPPVGLHAFRARVLYVNRKGRWCSLPGRASLMCNLRAKLRGVCEVGRINTSFVEWGGSVDVTKITGPQLVRASTVVR